MNTAVCGARRKDSAYKQIYDGEWEKATPGYLLACCDCALVHKLSFKSAVDPKTGKAQIYFRVWRVNRNTAQLRRWSGVIVRKKRARLCR